MTDKKLYEQIRQLVREQKQQNILDSRQQNFAEEYCRTQMLKKKQQKSQQSKINNLFKNFRNVESYINIMDIVNKLSLFHHNEIVNIEPESSQEIPEIIPKSIQIKIKEELGPILCKKYEEQVSKRQQMIQQLKATIDFGNEGFQLHNNMLRELQMNLKCGKYNQKLEIIDLLRNDIKRKQVYFLEKRFDKQLKDIEKVPNKIQHTKLFHKICSYLHMILQQEHKEKWASKQDKLMRQARRERTRETKRLSSLFCTFQNTPLSKFTRTTQSPTFKSQNQKLQPESSPLLKKKQSNFSFLHQNVLKNRSTIQNQSTRGESIYKKMKKLQSKKQLLKQNFTFRKRNIKAGVMVKINKFVDNINDQQKKNIELSKKYEKALQSLGEQAKTSFGRFQRQQIAEVQDIQDMKRYLDNTLSRNKKDLKKFHHL